MIRLSVNVNKVATLRNSRGGREPRLLDAVHVCLDAGVAGITVHPRADARHITIEDVHDIAHVLRSYPSVEFNIEGDPRPGLLDLVKEVRPQQCTLVPVVPGEITSQVGWTRGPQTETLADVVSGLKDEGIRVSLFVAPDLEAVRFAASVHGDRIELYTEPYAQAFSRDPESGRRSFETYAEAAELAASLGLGVNAGHDLDLENLRLFRQLPHLEEVSIGHALMSRALFVGLPTVVREYLSVLSPERER
jgi:pyridoxine 5-phosphate synthase